MSVKIGLGLGSLRASACALALRSDHRRRVLPRPGQPRHWGALLVLRQGAVDLPAHGAPFFELRAGVAAPRFVLAASSNFNERQAVGASCFMSFAPGAKRLRQPRLAAQSVN